ncbi:MAG: hypothetical protein AAF039_08665 [Bacteroidota bacterium]
MTSEQLKQRLYAKRMGKTKIDSLVMELLEFPELVGTLLNVVLEQDKSKENFNACWVLDHLMRKRLDYLLPHIDQLITELPQITWETSMRPIARILEALNEAYFVKKEAAFIRRIALEHQETMAEVCFDWLIGEHKVATKVFAMTSLFYLGERFNWVRPELKSVLELQIAGGTAGFKSRGGKILDKLRNLGY